MPLSYMVHFSIFQLIALVFLLSSTGSQMQQAAVFSKNALINPHDLPSTKQQTEIVNNLLMGILEH